MTDHSPVGRAPSAAVGSYRLSLRDWAAKHATELQLLVGLGLLILIFSLIEPSIYPTVDNVRNIARQAGILLVVSIGQMFAITVGGFDLSVGANMGFTSVATAQALGAHGVAPAIVIGLLVGAAIGLANGLLIAKLRVSPFVVTMAMLYFLTGYSNVRSAGSSVIANDPSFQWFGRTDWGFLPSTIGIGLIVLLLAMVFTGRTRIGLYVYGIGGSRETCRLAGIPVARYETVTYMITGMLAGAGGIMAASRVSVGQTGLGAGYELRSIAAAVIGGAVIGGGKGRLSGVFLGVALMTSLTVGLGVTGTSTFQQQMAIGVALVVAVLISQIRGGRILRMADVVPAFGQLLGLVRRDDDRDRQIPVAAPVADPADDDTR
ncbi:MAG: ABC transporter permease [bacterium]|nr:ABC transporter permease [bacterium]